MRLWLRRFQWVVLLTIAVHVVPLHATAQNVATRTLGVRWKAETPHLYFSARDIASRAVRTKLQSGLPQTVVTQVYAYRRNQAQPVAAFARSCRIVYDLWEESFRIHYEEGAQARTIVVRSMERALSHCVVVRGARVGRRRDFLAHAGESLSFAVLVEFNPVSDATVKRIRRWLSRPAGSSGRGDAFFGSFVSLFVSNRIGTAERVVRFRSQPVQVPARSSEPR